MITEEQYEKLEREGLKYFEEIKDSLDDTDYWTILRAFWIEGGENTEQWERLLFKSNRKREHKIMKSADRQMLKKLPKIITIYRACYTPEDEKKWNWTTDRNFAERYLKIRGIKYIAEKKVPKTEVFAYFNSRNEAEIILKKKY